MELREAFVPLVIVVLAEGLDTKLRRKREREKRQASSRHGFGCGITLIASTDAHNVRTR